METKEQMEQKKVEAEAFILTFKEQFCSKFGVMPIVHYAFQKGPGMSLNDLDEIATSVIDLKRYPQGLKTKKRYRELVLMRQSVFTIARSLDFSCSSIGEHFGFDHATVLHAEKTINALMEVKNQDAIRTMKLITDGIKIKFGDDGIFQHHTQERAHA